MKQLIISGLLVCLCASTVFAGKIVYLKDGGVIQAKSVWRSGGKVNVLVNRDTLAQFNPSEIDMKRTFKSKKHHLRKKTARAGAVTTSAVSSGDSRASSKPEKNKSNGHSLSVPSILEKSPSDLQGKEEGAIRKHKREMAEKAAE